MKIRRVFPGCGIMNPLPVHNEFVLIPAWFQRNAPLPRAACPATEHTQASRRPFIEIAAQIYNLCIGPVQRKQHPRSIRSLRVVSIILLPQGCSGGVHVLPFREERVRDFLSTRLKSVTFHNFLLPYSGAVVRRNACDQQRSGLASTVRASGVRIQLDSPFQNQRPHQRLSVCMNLQCEH
jgi:hypothetical protein